MYYQIEKVVRTETHEFTGPNQLHKKYKEYFKNIPK